MLWYTDAITKQQTRKVKQKMEKFHVASKYQIEYANGLEINPEMIDLLSYSFDFICNVSSPHIEIDRETFKEIVDKIESFVVFGKKDSLDKSQQEAIDDICSSCNFSKKTLVLILSKILRDSDRDNDYIVLDLF
jgi:hypothetical protein